MSDREKLIELLCRFSLKQEWMLAVANLADFLLANGVTVLPVQPEQDVYDISEFLDGTEHPEIFHWSDWWVNVGVDRENGGFMFLYDDVIIRHSDIGNTIFFSRKDAEAALMNEPPEEG